MTSGRRKITSVDILTFLDQKVDPERRERILDAIEKHPDLMKQLVEYAALQDGLHHLFDSILHEPIPEALLKALERPAASPGTPPDVPAEKSVDKKDHEDKDDISD